MSTAKARTPTPAMAATTYTSNSTSASTTHSSSTTRPRPNNNNNNNNPSTPARVPEPTTALTMQPQVRTTALTRTTSLYDVYPLTARQRDSNNSNDSFLLRPSLSRTRSQHLVPATDDADDLLRSADYFQSSRSVGGGSAGLFADATTSGHVDKKDHRSASMCSTFGKFHGEVYETKERSKVLSVLKRRGKTAAIDASRAAQKSAPAKFTAEDVVRAGTLTKEGSWRRNWKTRFFILRRDFPSLCYYTSEDKLELLGEIPIQPDTMVLDRSASGHAPYRFQIRSDSKTLLLEAESRDNQRRWIDSCQELVDAVRADKFRGSTTGLSRTSIMDRESSDSRQSNVTAAVRRSSMSKVATKNNNNAALPRPPSAAMLNALGGYSVESADPAPIAGTGAMKPVKFSLEGDKENPLFNNSSRGFLEDPSIDWSQLLEASSSSSWNDDEDSGAGSEPDFLVSGLSSLEPMAEDQVTDAGVLNSGRGRSNSKSKITIVSLNPNTMTHHNNLYDISIEISLGRKSKLMRSDAKEKTGCFVKVSGYLKQTKNLVEVGSTDAIKVSTLLAAAAAGEKPMSVPFTVVVSAELEQYAQLRFTLFKCSLSQSPGTAQACLGVGRCHVTDNFLNSYVKTIALNEKTTSARESQDALTAPSPHKLAQEVQPSPMPEEVDAQTTRGGAALFASPATNDGIEITIRAFPSLSPQQILPTTGIDMANTKYLIPTTMSADDPTPLDTLHSAEFTRNSNARTLLENGSFLGGSNDTGAHLRFIALDEILRVPRSTFALPLAYLDYLEEEVLERTRRLHKHYSSRNNWSHLQVTLIESELEYCRKKTEEYMKQRQFLMKQEKRLLDEQNDGKIFDSLRTMKKAASKQKEKDAEPEIVAPFKRSTYKSLDGWQFLPTNMQDQFLCAYRPANQAGSIPFAWHTMTMGCPAAHTKGFANGGYPHTDTRTGANSNNPAVSPGGDSLIEESCSSPMGGPSAAASTQTERTRRKSRVSMTKPPNQTDESVASLKTRLELKDRLDIIGCQILSAAVACIIATLDLAVLGSQQHRMQLESALKFGYLMNFESLLSTQGKEIGMLEDFAAGAKWLRNVFIQFRKHKTTGNHFVIKNYSPSDQRAFVHGGANENNANATNGPAAGGAGQSRSGNYLLVTIGVQESHMKVLPPLLMTGKPFRMRCVLFTQGVNEKQTLVHAYKASSVKVQDRINRENLEELKDLYAIFRRMHNYENDFRSHASLRRRATSVGGEVPLSRYSVQALDDLLAQIEHHICSSSNQFKKNVALLMDSSDFCRELGGSRVTCCKSGKDRTAMSVTLEQARICCAELKATQGSKIVSSMRLYGVRRKNVFLNTKADKFAFNEMQRKMLPDCYKPPAGTYKSGKT